MVDKLKIPMEKHSHLYKIAWVNDIHPNQEAGFFQNYSSYGPYWCNVKFAHVLLGDHKYTSVFHDLQMILKLMKQDDTNEKTTSLTPSVMSIRQLIWKAKSSVSCMHE